MKRIIGIWFAVLQVAALALPAQAQTHLDLALEDFVGHDQGVISGKTEDSFPIDTEAQLLYFTVDIDANGVSEIFVSRPDLAPDGIWGLYSDQLDENGEIIKVGIMELYTNTMRMGERDGVSGYYEYLDGGAGEGVLTFNSFDKDGNLVALWEAVVEPQGKDKALVDSLHLGRFDPAARKPDVKIVPLRPVWESHVKREQAKIREESEKQGAAVQAIPLVASSRREDTNVDQPFVSVEAPSNPWSWWIIIGIVIAFAVVACRCRGRFRRWWRQIRR